MIDSSPVSVAVATLCDGDRDASMHTSIGCSVPAIESNSST